MAKQLFQGSLSMITDAASEPITTAEAKSHARVDTTADDTLIDDYIAAATRLAQSYTNRQFVNATYEQTYPKFENSMPLDLAPLVSVASVKYTDINGTQQTLATSVYDVATATLLGQVRLAYNQSWPAIRRTEDGAIVIRFTAGYGTTAATVPEPIKTAIRFLVAHWYNIREPVVLGTIVARVPQTYYDILSPYKIERVVAA